MEDETEVNLIPECRYCDDSSGNCDDALLNSDISFNEYLSGYLARRIPPSIPY